MTRAEQEAKEIHYLALIEANKIAREQWEKGYKQAEKDLALTWEDVKNLDHLMNDVDFENGRAMSLGKEITFDGDDGFYGEVLKRFNEQRKK